MATEITREHRAEVRLPLYRQRRSGFDLEAESLNLENELTAIRAKHNLAYSKAHHLRRAAFEVRNYNPVSEPKPEPTP